MIQIKLSIQSRKQEILIFLGQLHSILRNHSFNINTDLTLIQSLSTPYTLLDLDYDISDVVDRLKELTVEEYSETLFDRDDPRPPFLFVFGKNINSKQIYIKLKIKGVQTRHVLCVSFHYAEERMYFPYA